MDQKEKNYYLKLIGYTLLGLAVIGAILWVVYIIILSKLPNFEVLVAFFATYIAPVILIIIISIVILFIVYVALFIGVALRYIGKPMKVSKKDKKYSIKKTKEAGKRQKGSSKKE